MGIVYFKLHGSNFNVSFWRYAPIYAPDNIQPTVSSSPLSSTLIQPTVINSHACNSSSRLTVKLELRKLSCKLCLQTLINSHRRLLGLKWSYDLRFMFMFWIQIPNQIFNPNLDSKTSSNPNSNHKSNHNCNSYLANSLLCSTVISFKTFIPIFNIDQWQAVTRVGF